MIRRALLCSAALLTSACNNTNKDAPAQPGSSPVSFSSGPAAAAPKIWDDALGFGLATPASDGGAPFFFARDTANRSDVEVELLSHDDRTVRAALHPGDAVRACSWRRRATISTTEGKPAPNTWALALAAGIATPFGIDGVTELLPRDSATFVARVSRLASAIPEDSVTAPFRGLPIVVRDGWRFQLPDSTTIVVAIAMRSLNVESNPRAQSMTLIAEPDPSAAGDAWRTAFSESEAGPEDRVEGSDLLAAFLIGGKRVAVALTHESESGLQLEIVERVAPGSWKIRWSSGSLPCAKP